MLERIWFRVCAAVTAWALLAPAIARAADEYVPVTGKNPEQIPATGFIAGAYGFIWVAVLVYVLFVARGLGRVRGEVADLRRQLERKP